MSSIIEHAATRASLSPYKTASPRRRAPSRGSANPITSADERATKAPPPSRSAPAPAEVNPISEPEVTPRRRRTNVEATPNGESSAATPSTSLIDEGQMWCATQSRPAPVVEEVVDLWRQRNRWLSAELKLVLQAQAICRGYLDATRGDEVSEKKSKSEGTALYEKLLAGERSMDAMLVATAAPFIDSIMSFQRLRKSLEKDLVKLARDLPAYEWVKGVWGFGALGFVGIVGEAGDVGSYRSPACLWKRMGLAVFDGNRQRKTADKELAILYGYNAKRRSHVWNVGNGLIGGMGNGPRPAVGSDIELRGDWSPYQKLFVERLRHEAARDPEHRRPDTADGKESYSKHAAARAKRYVEKRALRDLWRAWRAEVGLDLAGAWEG